MGLLWISEFLLFFGDVMKITCACGTTPPHLRGSNWTVPPRAKPKILLEKYCAFICDDPKVD